MILIRPRLKKRKITQGLEMTTLQLQINPGQLPAYSDAYERDKLRILQQLNNQVSYAT